MDFKLCPKCKEYLPHNNFSNNKMNNDGLSYYCKKCLSKSQKQTYIKHSEKVKEKAREYRKNISIKEKKIINSKYCIVCKQTLLIENFCNDAYSLDGKSNKCRKCSKIKNKNWRNNNKEYSSYKSKIYAKNNEDKIKLYHKQYRKENLEKRRIYEQKREAVKKKLDKNFDKNDWDICKNYFNNRCAYCGEEKILTQDHFIALSKNGEYTKNNIIPACKNCNSSKRHSDFFEWYPKQESYSKKREQKILKYLNYDLKTKIQQLVLI